MGGNPAASLTFMVVAALLFGAGQIPELMRGLGSGLREFKKGLDEDPGDDES